MTCLALVSKINNSNETLGAILGLEEKSLFVFFFMCLAWGARKLSGGDSRCILLVGQQKWGTGAGRLVQVVKARPVYLRVIYREKIKASYGKRWDQ